MDEKRPFAEDVRHQRLFNLVTEERRPRDHDEWMVYRIAERRCSLATGTWPCDICLSNVASVIRDIENVGYKLRQTAIPATQSDDQVTGSTGAEFVRWQKCPVCDGTGLVSRPRGVAADQPTFVSTSCGPWPCGPCTGSGLLRANGPTILELENGH